LTCFQYGWKGREDPAPSYFLLFYAFGQLLFAGLVYTIGMLYFPPSIWYSIEFFEFPLWKRILYTNLIMFFTKFKYHFGWKALDLSALSSSCAFTKAVYDEKTKDKPVVTWDRARNINTFKTAWPEGTPDVTNNWNMPVNDWLKYCSFFQMSSHNGPFFCLAVADIYWRITAPKWILNMLGSDKSARQMITRMISAVFHVCVRSFLFYFCHVCFCQGCLSSLLRIFLPNRICVNGS